MPLYSSPDEIGTKQFDYIVVGAGTAGLALASRLTENENLSVLVLEAGGSHYDDPLIDVPSQLGATFMNPKYDWAFPVVEQPHANNRESIWPRGKGLGGSSAMNFFCWIKPPAEDINAFERLGNPGWNWNDYQKYSLQAEKFYPAVKEIADVFPHSHNEEFRGKDGFIEVTDPIHVHTVEALFFDTLANKGIKRVDDPYGGDITGCCIASASVNPKTWKRSYSANTYLRPFQDRKNFHVLMNAYVSRVIWAEDKDSLGNLVATGVEYISGETTQTAAASKEVILSAGAIKSPQILELSGVGRNDVLEKIGIPSKLELPGVGENVQEHNFFGMVYELDTTTTDYQTLDLLLDPEFAKESMRLHGEGKGLFRSGISGLAFLPLTTRDPQGTGSLIASLESDIKDRIAQGKISPALAKQFEIQLSVLKDDKLPDMEVVVYPGFFGARAPPAQGKRFITVIGALNHPFSRGYIHARSNDPLDNPEINPKYFEENFDLKVLLEHAKFARSLTETEPFKSNCTEIAPGPSCESDEQLEDFIKNTYSTTFHTIGSCSMLPREDGGVVDPNLKVYGTKNLRVVDLSIVPIHVAAHMQATAYAIGEKAASLIKATI